MNIKSIVTAIHGHRIDHGVNEGMEYDPKTSLIDQKINEIKEEQTRCLDDLMNFNKKYNNFQILF
jgi:hypothetical protein